MVEGLKKRVASGDYSVDPHVVAEAILTRSPWGRTMEGGLCSEVLVAVQPLGSPDSGELEALAGDDAA